MRFMSELPLQQALARLLTDGKGRESIFAGDISPLAEYGLSTEQQQHILQINRERVEVFAELLIINRLSKAIDGLPLTTHLLGSQLGQIAVAFNQAYPPKHSKKYLEAMAFAQFLKEQFRLQPPSPQFLEDVLLYEMNSLELRFEFNRPDELVPTHEISLLTSQLDAANELLSETVPHRLSCSRIISLEYNVEQIGEEIAQGRFPTTVEKRPMHILLHIEPSGVLTQTEINVPTLVFIEKCDGRATLNAIVEDLARDFQQSHLSSDFKGQCLRLCEELIELHIITLKPRLLQEKD
jgi:hypothetical protein